VRSLDRVTILNTSDVGGGAERIAMTLLDGFAELGTDTWLAVGRKQSNHPRVVSLYESPRVDYRVRTTRLRRARAEVRRPVDTAIGLEDFNHPYSRLVPQLSGSRPDLLFCNNLHGGYFDLRQLPRLSRELPVVLRLSDSWTFTGHCAVPSGCERWRGGCGHCPDLAIPPAVKRDATRLNWLRKRRIFARSRLYVTAPSHWMLKRALESILAPAIVGARVIPSGVDLTAFRPEGPKADRQDRSVHRLVFVANGGAANPYKDFATLRAALSRLAGAVELIVVGGGERVERVGDGITIRHEPTQPPARLAALYRSADAYVHAAFEDTFPLAAAEALACGTPVVAASRGGVHEFIDDGLTGILVEPGDELALAAAMRQLLSDTGLRDRMGAAAADTAVRRLDRNRMVRDLHTMCEEALEASEEAGPILAPPWPPS
jgi:glycosyltransferase involved in cell wall biosynthesis